MDRSRGDRILADWDRISRETTRPGMPQGKTVMTTPQVSTITGGVLLVLVVVVAGLRLGLPPGSSQPGAEASASPVEPSASPVEASPSPMSTWGPLAVLPPTDGMDTLRAEGTLRITDRCVFLETTYLGRLFMFWHVDQVTWSEESQAITFKNADGSVVTVRDGDHLVVGGSGGSTDYGLSGEEFLTGIEAVAPPASSCTLDPWWSVGAAER